jgi:hypothetical protein
MEERKWFVKKKIVFFSLPCSGPKSSLALDQQRPSPSCLPVVFLPPSSSSVASGKPYTRPSAARKAGAAYPRRRARSTGLGPLTRMRGRSSSCSERDIRTELPMAAAAPDLTDDGDDAAGRGVPAEVRPRPRRRQGRRGSPRRRRWRRGIDLWVVGGFLGFRRGCRDASATGLRVRGAERGV